MIRHIHNANTHHALSTKTATRTTTESNTTTDGSDSFRKLFDSSTSSGASVTPQITGTITKDATPAPAVTLTPPHFEQGVTVTNPDGSVVPLNYTQFATDATAQEIATKLGGTVATSQMEGYSATQRSISVPGSANLVNAGIAAQLFARYGDKPGSQAWQIINRDLGRDPMAT